MIQLQISKRQSKKAEKLRRTKVFIWDEAPMAPRYASVVANKILQDRDSTWRFQITVTN